jgi:hypothetical protein
VALSVTAAGGLGVGRSDRADILWEWTQAGMEAATAARQAPTAQTRTMAMLHLAMFEAVDALDVRYAPYLDPPVAPQRGASAEAAAAVAAHTVLISLFHDQRTALDDVLARSLAAVPVGPAREAGERLGETVGARIVAARAGDGAEAPDTWSSPAPPGVYVPTATPVGSAWGRVAPWAMTAPSQFRPAPPPRIDSPLWARDCEEVRTLGGKRNTRRTSEQTEAARFWTMAGPSIWLPILHQLASEPGRSLVQNARAYALVSAATADAYIAAFDAKYAYNFWRPLTAIRSAKGMTDSDALEAAWEPLIETPMHPEYPCAHCITSGAALAVMEAEFGAGELRGIDMTSRAAPGVTRRWRRLSEWQAEVANARIWGGIHYRNSTTAGTDAGRRIGEWTVARILKPAPSRSP